MADEMSCPDCDHGIESVDDLVREEIPEIEVDADGSFDLFGKNDLFLCKGCRKPMGVGHEKR